MKTTYYSEQRAKLIEQLKERGITDTEVLNAMSSIPREKFIHTAFAQKAYEDSALPLANLQTISQPYTVAYMTSLLNIQPNDIILEIGTGSGYQAAVLAKLGAKVYSIEREYELYSKSTKILQELGFSVQTRFGDGTIGWSQHAPYDGIIVTAGAPDIPNTLLKQLKIGGKMVIPSGDRQSQTLYLITRQNENDYDSTQLEEFKFVPLIGREGWQDSK
ncbi:MAG: protein-L-isoaspartate(D-aspartate) O-methyltransferase [Ignavibacteria bacterium]|nr:protein-L-isoaspartate(D-aspartate) O-methyltransferase [Ignavibacteria bacterium]